jgi:hypothetical protein
VNSGTRQGDKQTETSAASCGGFFLLGFPDWVRCKRPRGRCGRRAGERLRLIAPSMGPAFRKGTRKLANWDPICRNGTRNQQWGPAIDYSNVLGVKLCLLQFNVSPPQSISGPLRRGNSQHFRFRISEPQLQVTNSRNWARNQQAIADGASIAIFGQFIPNSPFHRAIVAIAVDVSPSAAHPEAMRLPIRLGCTLPERGATQNPGSSSA